MRRLLQSEINRFNNYTALQIGNNKSSLFIVPSSQKTLNNLLTSSSATIVNSQHPERN